jgi:flavin reductase (DIM6/NTAB) family NADH-FMN oxidoreductase RutF
MIEPQEFRNALGRFATGVTVVTVMDGEEPHGITVNSFMSVSLVPPLVAVSIGRPARAHELLTVGRHFGVSVLRRGQEDISDMFADRSVVVRNPLVVSDGFPFVREAIARLLCRVTQSHSAGDHTIFVGEIERLAYDEGEPLLYHRSRYVEGVELAVAEVD